ncbi:lipid-A-disaccharide synthase [Limibacillus sp. MBR-115]|jgi:lipid-A-disaccharide synthase|uniref:lipid-A-disaccharide synthase n=1 Tax=Limibacillus sp. MBR-115 TaxID=3156465 RepID=UPI003391778A
MNPDTVKVFVFAGEPSGDQLGAAVMKDLAGKLNGRVLFAGVGGPAMEDQGLQSLFPMQDLSVMGLVEVLGHLPRLTRRMQETIDAAVSFQPDLFLSIDSPSFSLRVAERLRKRHPDGSLPLVHLVAPSVWAWKAWRAKAMAGYLDHLLTLLPFEPPYFQRHGLPATFVGHPAAHLSADAPTKAAAMRTLGLAEEPNFPVLCLLPGSRRMEIARLLPLFKQTLGFVLPEVANLKILLPTVPAVSSHVRAEVAKWPWQVTVLDKDQLKRAAFTISDLALAASGTVAVELAAAKVPAIITYKVNAVSAFFARRMLKVRYVSLVNLIMEREIQPEFIQDRARPDLLASAILQYLGDGSACARQIAALEPALALMQGPTGNPAGLAGEVLQKLLSESVEKKRPHIG